MATAEPSSEATKLKATFRFNEFGEPMSGVAGRFGWLGGKQRRTELPSGVIQMGVRSYVPQIGRFLSRDPVAGGSANAYDYPNADPIDGLDLAGTKPWDVAELGPCTGDMHVYSPTNYGGRNGYGKFYVRLKVKCGGFAVTVQVQKVTRRYETAGGTVIAEHSHLPTAPAGPHWQGEWGNWSEKKKPTKFGCLNGVEYKYTYEIQIQWASLLDLLEGLVPPGQGTLPLEAEEECGHGPY